KVITTPRARKARRAVLAALVRLGSWPRLRRDLGRHVNFASCLLEALAHLIHPLLRRSRGVGAGYAGIVFLLFRLQPREPADLGADLHRAEFGPAHRAEVRGLGTFGGEGLVVERLGGLGVQ